MCKTTALSLVGLLALNCAGGGYNSASAPRQRPKVAADRERPPSVEPVVASPTALQAPVPDGEDAAAKTDGSTGESEWRWIRWRPTDREAPRRGGGYDRNTSYELVNSEHSHLLAYDTLFPQRLSRRACERAPTPGYVFPWIYSLIEGAFTGPGERQKLYRIAHVPCPVSIGNRFIQEIVVEQDSKIVARFEVPDRMYVGYQYDIDQDGVTEAIVEWHRGLTPAVREGVLGIVSVKGGVYRELYHGKWEVTGDCPRKGAPYHQVALGVRRISSDKLEILEEEWQVGCDPHDVEGEVGEWKMTQSQTSTIQLGLVAAHAR